MQRVLFLCTGNSARSQMAEAFLRKYGEDRFEAHSAGLEPKGLNPLTIKVMQEAGIDVSGQKSKGVGVYLGKVLFQYLITVCDDAEKNCPSTCQGSVSANTGLSKIQQHWKAQMKKNLPNFARCAIKLKLRLKNGLPTLNRKGPVRGVYFPLDKSQLYRKITIWTKN